MSVQRIASRYAKSLIDIAVEQNKLDRVLEDIYAFREANKNRDLQLLLKSPIVQASKKAVVMKALFGDKFDALTMAFLLILCSKGREMYPSDISVEFISQYKKIKHISTVKVISAVPLNRDVLNAIHDKLVKSSATDTHVEIVEEVDPHLLGGFIFQFDDKIYDASVAHQLEKLRKDFDENLYVSQIMA